jgi:hypothetical protein
MLPLPASIISLSIFLLRFVLLTIVSQYHAIMLSCFYFDIYKQSYAAPRLLAAAVKTGVIADANN